MFGKGVHAEWQEDEKNGRRLVVRGTTYRQRPVIAYLVPVNENEGTFRLKTAIAESASQ